VGLLRNLLRRKMKDPVRGTATVVACNRQREGIWQQLYAELVIEAPGVPAAPIEWTGLAHHSKWPEAGRTLPVTVDRADPTHLKVEWDDVETNDDIARRKAEQIADARRGEQAGS
jgi:hypothetical protein